RRPRAARRRARGGEPHRLRHRSRARRLDLCRAWSRAAKARRDPRAQVAARARADASPQAGARSPGADESRQGALALAREHASVIADDAIALDAPAKAARRRSPGDVGSAERRLGGTLDVDFLIVLLDTHAHAPAGPDAPHRRRYDPQVKRALVALPGVGTGDLEGLARVGPPAGHAEGVGDDAC